VEEYTLTPGDEMKVFDGVKTTNIVVRHRFSDYIPLSLDEGIVIMKMYNRLAFEGLAEKEDLQMVQRIVTNWPFELDTRDGDYGEYWVWAGIYIMKEDEKEFMKYVDMKKVKEHVSAGHRKK
jgi:hypothetical protein